MNCLFTDGEIQEAVGGRVTQKGWTVTGVSIDSRTILNGELFVAINSKRDGHDFLISAIKNGAIAAIVTKIPPDIPDNFPCIVVNDSLEALQDLARFSRKRHKSKLIAITGSVGKTSTKAMLTKVLSEFGSTYSSPKSYNNYLGVPLTLANIPIDTCYVVCEIGMSSKGEIEPLSNLVKPDIAVITNISAAHLASFDDIEAIAREKSMICSGLVENGLLIFPSDTTFSDILIGIADKRKVRYVTFGSHYLDNIVLERIMFKNNKTFINVTIKGVTSLYFEVDALGYHHASNCLAVLGVLADLNLDLNLAVNYIKNWQAVIGRGKFLDVKMKEDSQNILIRVIDESYNCNPTSLKASLDVVRNLDFDSDQAWNHHPFRRIAILGDMLELGHRAKEFHQEIAQLDSLNCFNKIHCVGSLMRHLYNELPASKKGLLVKSPSELIDYLFKHIKDRDVYIIKGSNSIGLSFLVTELCKLDGQIISR